ncbi:MAG: hypothetical protein ACEY27_00025 [Candidatus Hodgkinia cicadicola]
MVPGEARVPPRVGPVIRSGIVSFEHDSIAAELPAKPEPKITNFSERQSEDEHPTGWGVLVSFTTGWEVVSSAVAEREEVKVLTSVREVFWVFVTFVTFGFAIRSTFGWFVNIS